MHSSIYAIAHYLINDLHLQEVSSKAVFDIRTDEVFISMFIRIIDCHLTIIRVFQRLLKKCVHGDDTWSHELASVTTAYQQKHEQWKPFITKAIPS